MMEGAADQKLANGDGGPMGRTLPRLPPYQAIERESANSIERL